jgi:type VI protein secretion system component VasK
MTNGKYVRRRLRDFRNDKRGILLVGIVTMAFIVMSSLIWLVGALVVNRVFDAFTPLLNAGDPRALIAAQNAVNAYGVSIVVIDILLLVYWAISAQRIESEESPAGVAPF